MITSGQLTGTLLKLKIELLCEKCSVYLLDCVVNMLLFHHAAETTGLPEDYFFRYKVVLGDRMDGGSWLA